MLGHNIILALCVQSEASTTLYDVIQVAPGKSQLQDKTRKK
jgi:hypothetical protein